MTVRGSKFSGRKWKALMRELEALRRKHTGKLTLPFPDLSCEQRPSVAPLSNRILETKTWKRN